MNLGIVLVRLEKDRDGYEAFCKAVSSGEAYSTLGLIQA